VRARPAATTPTEDDAITTSFDPRRDSCLHAGGRAAAIAAAMALTAALAALVGGEARLAVVEPDRVDETAPSGGDDDRPRRRAGG